MEDPEKIKNGFENMTGGDTPVLVDFFATWCGPCRMMHPILEELKNKLGDSIRIIKLDIDNKLNIKVVQKYRIRSVPTLMLFRKGELLWSDAGVRTAAELEKTIKEKAGI